MSALLSHRNHFRFGYDGEWFRPRASPADKWQVAYGPCEREPGDWRAECIETARQIRRDTTLPLWVMASGGIDSEVVLQAFKFAGVEFSAAVLKFADGSNQHDVRYAIKFCELHRIAYRVLTLDLEKFLTSGEALAYAERTQCMHAMLVATMWAMDQVDGYPILGSGECYLVRGGHDASTGQLEPLPPGTWAMHEKERIASWFRYLIASDRPGCAGFFQYLPECILAFLRDPAVAALCTGQGPSDVTNTATLKAELYARHFLLEPRPKYHGYEHVMHLVAPLTLELERRFKLHDAVARTPYDKLVTMLAPLP
jgi:hypothetical protein